jgi:acetyl esterase/lipase
MRSGTNSTDRELGSHDAGDPLASPLHADLAGLPPIRVHRGDDEVLLDDSVRFVERAVATITSRRVWTRREL